MVFALKFIDEKDKIVLKSTHHVFMGHSGPYIKVIA